MAAPAPQTLTIKDGNATSQSMAVLQDAAGNNRTIVDVATAGVSAFRFSANFTPQATNAVTLISIQGSATKTVRVKRIWIGGVSTAVSQSIYQLVRTSALGAGGTTVSPTAAKMDSSNAAATAVVSHYTTTLKATGTAVGGPISMSNVQTGVVTTPATLALGFGQYIFPESGVLAGPPLVLRGTADYIEVQNVTPASLGAGTVLFYSIELEEDNS